MKEPARAREKPPTESGTKMKTIDADTHVVETEQIWKYMDESDAKFRPVLLGQVPM